MQRCLQVATSIDDKSKHIILNNIKAINYEEAVKLAKTIIIDDNKRKLLLSEEVFVNDSTLAQYLEREELDALKLHRHTTRTTLKWACAITSRSSTS